MRGQVPATQGGHSHLRGAAAAALRAAGSEALHRHSEQRDAPARPGQAEYAPRQGLLSHYQGDCALLHQQGAEYAECGQGARARQVAAAQLLQLLFGLRLGRQEAAQQQRW